MTSRDEALAQVERLITECEHRIAGQREIIADAAVEKGRDATMAETHPRDLDRLAAGHYPLGCRAREPNADQVDHQLDREAVREQQRLRAAVGAGGQ
jgi:hypothetical protein